MTNPIDAPPDADPRALALARLAASRERLLVQLLPPPGPTGRSPRRLGALWRWLRRQTRQAPMLALAVDGLGRWWQAHPWRPAGELLADEARAHLAPVVRRHPWRAVAAAAALGGALAVAQPWRWAVVAGALAQLPRQARRWATAQLGALPLGALAAQWLAGRAAPVDDA